MLVDKELVSQILDNQAKNIWNYSFKSNIEDFVDEALFRCEESFLQCTNKALSERFNPYHSVQYSIFLYYLSRCLYLKNCGEAADVIYYLNKNLNNVEWFYGVDLPVHFCAEHPLGSVLGKASYGDHLFVYQGTVVGGNRRNEKIYYPVMGNNIIMYANSSIIGNCRVGNNVLIAANTHVLNKDIPSNSIVYGRDRDIVIVQKTEEEIKDKLKAYWSILS